MKQICTEQSGKVFFASNSLHRVRSDALLAQSLNSSMLDADRDSSKLLATIPIHTTDKKAAQAIRSVVANEFARD